MNAVRSFAIILAVGSMLAFTAQAHAGSTDEIRDLLSTNPYDAARLPAEQLCELNAEARRMAGVADAREDSVLCEATQGPIEAPEGLDVQGQAYFDQLTEKIERAIQLSEEQQEYSTAEMNICKKILCAAAPGGPRSIKECEDDGGPIDVVVGITRGKRPQCPMVQW